PPPPPPPTGGRWQPAVTDSWHWQLNGTLLTNIAAQVYDIDLFDNSVAAITALQARNIRVICYFSAGSSEDFRSDFGSFAAADMGKALDGYPNERWLDIRSQNVRTIMAARLNLAQNKGCDGVEPDNVDGYTNDTGFSLTAQDQLTFNRWLALEAHARGMVVGLKNDVDQLFALQPDFDFAVNEQCHEFDECGGYSTFIAAGKPVFNAEYHARYERNSGGARDSLCAAARRESFRTLVLPLELDGRFRFSCDS
ncbi:MAG: endo alpha-1,4 polygalactosaminidase, partial [Sphingopyxis sp.]